MRRKLHLYFIAVTWFILSLFSSTANDIISKYVGLHLHSCEVTFFRFLFGSISLMPFIIYYGKETLKTSHPYIHIVRGILLFFGMTAWTYGLTLAPVTTATVVSWAIPLFTLILATFFLNENIIWQRWLVTIAGLVGIIIILDPNASDFNPETLIFVLAAVAFAMLDIINKKFVIRESMLSMLFYSAIITAILSIPATIMYWQPPTQHELLLLFILGASANLILFFILKAFALADITALAPYRYLELIISSLAAYFVFNELPKQATFYGALILIPSTLFIIYSEKKVINKEITSSN
jgi:S-adenosylmethionine uptake transporter